MYHKHHIIPRHMGGSDDPSNLKLVTVEEHAQEHKFLWGIYGKKEDYIAWQALSKLITKEEARIQAVKSSNTGRKQSKDHLEKRMASIAKWRKENGHSTLGKKLGPASEERKAKISAANKGKPGSRNGATWSDSERQKLSEAAKNRERFTCPKCGVTMQKANLSRYHGINGEKCHFLPPK